MKRARIYIDDLFCGILTEDPEGYHFKYDEQYMAMPNAKALSPTMPFQVEEYEKEIYVDNPVIIAQCQNLQNS